MHTPTRRTTRVLVSLGLVFSALLSACGGGDQGRDPVLGLPAAELVSLSVTPPTGSVAVGLTQQYSASGNYSDGSVRDLSARAVWSSASPATASITASGGLAKGLVAGAAAMTASAGGKSGSATLTVLPATLLSLSVTPQAPVVQVGATRQLAALASYSDGKVVDVSASAAFVSTAPAIASSSPNGLVTGLSTGSAPVNVSFGGKSASTTVTVPALTMTALRVTPATSTVVVGGVQQFVAIATYSDNSTAFVTTTAQWNSASPATASIDAAGLATGKVIGASLITAASGALSANATLTVIAAPVGGNPPVLPGALSVNLGSAASFGVLAGTSLTSNAGGTTLIKGDVGSPSQTVDPTLAAGFTNYKSGAILANALADLQVAITDANGRACDVSFAGDIDLGGLVLPPGVYCYAGAISITGTLTLNGPGVYIFRTALTLNSTANSSVMLKNGATAADVNWVPVGATTLGANAAFQGSILGKSAAITVGDNTTLLNGRVLSAAAVTLSNNQITK
ncbi:MAG: ice-binding family protein [Massilia sp.]